MYWLPWSWRIVSPRATPGGHPSEVVPDPWRTGSNASKRVPYFAACSPTHSAVQ
jgi:hypothetical protein